MIQRPPPRARPLTLAALALVVGLVTGLYGHADPLPAAALAAVASAAAALASDGRRALVVSALLGISTAGAMIGLSTRRTAATDCRNGWRSGERVRVVAVAVGFLPAGERGAVRLRPERGDRAGECLWAGPLRVWAEGPVRPGASYEIFGDWRPAPSPGIGPRPPERRGWIVAERLAPVRRGRWIRHPFLAARGALAGRLWRVYPPRWAPLAQALVLGQRETLHPQLTRRIARAGLAHLLAISGLHVGMLAAALFGLARIARLSAEQAHLVTIAATWGYVLLIGAPASAVRAALMVSLWSLSRLAGRASSAFDVLGLSAVLLLLARPWSVVEPGFQLSFAGAAAVGYAHSEARRWRDLRRLGASARAVSIGLLASAAAVALTAPITATHFGRVAPAAVVGNLAAIPLLALAMPPLFLSALLSPWASASAWPASAAVLLLQAIDGLARLLGGLRWASLDVSGPGVVPVLAYLVLLVFGAHALRGAWQRRRFILALGVVGAAAIGGPPLAARFAPDRLSVYVLDVGQGDAIAIATPQRHWLLVDAGPSIAGFDAGRRRVLPFLREQGARRLEAWLASHPDLDHVGGAPAVLSAMDVERVIGSGRVTGQTGQIAVLRWLAASSRRWTRATAGARLSVDGVELVFLHPGEAVAGSDPSSPNEHSLVFLLEYGEFRMLFTGDVPGEVEDRLSRERGADLHAQVLKVSHHGSASSTSGLFLESVQPQLAVISVGRGNRYGHPSPRVLWRLRRHHVPVRRTDREGTVVIEARRDGSWRVRSAAEGF